MATFFWSPTIKEFGQRWWGSVLAPWTGDSAALDAAFQQLVAAYCEPGRYYHNLDHIRQVLETVAQLCQPEIPPPLVLAAWFHDAVYDSRAKDNEERSANLASSVLTVLGVSAAVVQETERLILLTRQHTASSDDAAGKILTDADLAILGCSPEEYDRYAVAIRREYAWVPDESYRTGRCEILRRILERPQIYATTQMRRTHEAQARQNLQREVVLLQGGS